ncbi:hypothetical protein FACS1894206_09620 [Deltaproteobacteria bacterium]|nr:hypothetical protein FACS1894206_09620 [Deltaproteobacteria bacterium]
MPFYKIELFGHVVYSPDLTYYALLEQEEAFKTSVQAILEKAEGAFIHFEALGDILRFQCMFSEEKDEFFHQLCDAIAPHVKDGLDARLLLVDKDLDTIYFYTLAGGKWQEAVIGFPPAGRLAETKPVKLGRMPTQHKKPNTGGK